MQIAKRKSFLVFCTHFLFAHKRTHKTHTHIHTYRSDNILTRDKVAACHFKCLEIRVLTESRNRNRERERESAKERERERETSDSSNRS